MNTSSQDAQQPLPPSGAAEGSGQFSRFSQCPNCQTSFQPDWRYCPGCGQENRAVIASFSTLVTDFLGDFFTFDSRFFRTIFPFFFRPGLLTRDYLEGHRVRYVGPIRILVFGCILLFALVGRKINQQSWEFSSPDGTSPIQLSFKDDSDTLNAQEEGLPIPNPALDSASTSAVTLDTAALKSNRREDNFQYIFKQIPLLSDSLSPEEIGNELVPKKSYWRRKLVVQSAKVYQSQGKSLVTYMVGNGTLIILVSVFMQSIFMRLLYIRRKHHFIEHFIFTTHAHAAIVYLLVFLLLLEWITGSFAAWSAFILIPYLYLSLLKVYRQSWKKTLVKYGIISITYLMLFMPILGAVALGISFLFI